MRNKIPKEIYPCIFAGDRLWFEQEHWFTQDGKYLSEEHFNSLIEEKDKEIERLKSEIPKWINLDEENPKIEDVYLCLITKSVGGSYGHQIQFVLKWFMGAFINPFDTNIKLTHWMPLPKTPTK